MHKLTACILLVLASYANSSPCTGVDRSLSVASKNKFAPVIAEQLKVESVAVKQSFKVGSWSIIYVETPNSDPPFLFYSGNPLSNQYVLLWAGAAASNEQQKIEAWVLKMAPGIPHTLAQCFAWHVASNKDNDWGHKMPNNYKQTQPSAAGTVKRWRVRQPLL